MLHESLTKIKLYPTLCNRVVKQMQHVACNNVAQCCMKCCIRGSKRSEWKNPIVCCQLNFWLLKISNIIEIKKL